MANAAVASASPSTQDSTRLQPTTAAPETVWMRETHRQITQRFALDSPSNPFAAETSHTLSTRAPIVTDRIFAGTITHVRRLPTLARDLLTHFEQEVLPLLPTWFGHESFEPMPSDYYDSPNFGSNEYDAQAWLSAVVDRLAQFAAGGVLGLRIRRGSQYNTPQQGASDISLFLHGDPYVEIPQEVKLTQALTEVLMQAMLNRLVLPQMFDMAQDLPTLWQLEVYSKAPARSSAKRNVLSPPSGLDPYPRRRPQAASAPVPRTSGRPTNPSQKAKEAAILEDFSALSFSSTAKPLPAERAKPGQRAPISIAKKPQRKQPALHQWQGWGFHESTTTPVPWDAMDDEMRAITLFTQQLSVQLAVLKQRNQSSFQPLVFGTPDHNLPMFRFGTNLLVCDMEKDLALVARMKAVFLIYLRVGRHSKLSDRLLSKHADQAEYLQFFKDLDVATFVRNLHNGSSSAGAPAAGPPLATDPSVDPADSSATACADDSSSASSASSDVDESFESETTALTALDGNDETLPKFVDLLETSPDSSSHDLAGSHETPHDSSSRYLAESLKTSHDISRSLVEAPLEPTPDLLASLERAAKLTLESGLDDLGAFSGCYKRSSSENIEGDGTAALYLSQHLGSGWGGDVYGDSTGRFAVKVVAPRHEESLDEYRDRLDEGAREHQALVTLRGRRLQYAPMYIGLFGGAIDDIVVLLLIFEFIPGVVLQTWGDVARHRSVCVAAVEALHNDQIEHGDLRPANFIVKPNGAVKIIDWARSRVDARPDELALEREQFLYNINAADCNAV
ncbi:hypothetical protein NBRC10512v2_008075 [Rhodotorula toruloides]